MKDLLAIFILSLSSLTINAQAKVNYQQIGFEYFMDNLYNADLFKKDCNALTFDKDFCIKICLDTVYPLDLQMSLVDKFITQRDTIRLLQNDTLLFEKYLIHNNGLSINYSNYKNVEKYPFKQAPRENIGIPTLKKGKDFDTYQNSFNCYLLRFSSSVKYRGKTYIELWIKQGFQSSGERIFFEFDSNDNIIYHKISSGCDDWG
jgi:hypothetical protein